MYGKTGIAGVGIWLLSLHAIQGCGSSSAPNASAVVADGGEPGVVDAGPVDHDIEALGNEQPTADAASQEDASDEQVLDGIASTDSSLSIHLACKGSCDVTNAVPCAKPDLNCVTTCERIFAASRCRAEFNELLLCNAKAGSGAFTCARERPGYASLMAGYCADELSRLFCTEGRGDAGGAPADAPAD